MAFLCKLKRVCPFYFSSPRGSAYRFSTPAWKTPWAQNMQEEPKKLPNFVSWRNAGILQPIRDQMLGDTCSLFATVGSMESMLTIGSNISTTLSVQHVLETVHLIKEREKKRGKNAEKKTHFSGTFSNRVWDAILKYGITTEELYPYKGGIITKGISLEKLQFRKLYRIQGYGLVRPDAYDATALMRRVAKQPTVAPVDASFWPRKGWKGVQTGRQRVSAHTNHEVLVVGYANNVVTKTPYWEFRNSWGPDFCDQGYGRVALGCNAFGIESENWYPLMTPAHNKDSNLKIQTDNCDRILRELYIYDRESKSKTVDSETFNYYRDAVIPECCFRLNEALKDLKCCLALEAMEKGQDIWFGKQFGAAERIVRQVENVLGDQFK